MKSMLNILEVSDSIFKVQDGLCELWEDIAGY